MFLMFYIFYVLVTRLEFFHANVGAAQLGGASPLDRRARACFVLQGDDVTGELEENLERLNLDIPDASIDDLPLRYQRPTAGVPGRFSRLLCRVSWVVMCYHKNHQMHDVSTKSLQLQDFCMVIFYLKAYTLQMRSRDLFFVKHVHIYISIYRLLLGVYTSQMVNAFYMIFMCLLQFIDNEPSFIFMS